MKEQTSEEFGKDWKMKSRMFAFATLLTFIVMGVAVAQTTPPKPAETTPATPTQTGQTGEKPAMQVMPHKNMLAPATPMNLMQVAERDGHFNTFLQLCHEAGMTAVLTGKGPYTVFAPADEAFSKLPPGQLAALKSDTTRLREVLRHHIVEGKETMSSEMLKMHNEKIKPMSGGEMLCAVRGDTMTIGEAKIIGHEMMASNGVIHIVDRVMLPPAAPAPAVKPESPGK